MIVGQELDGGIIVSGSEIPGFPFWRKKLLCPCTRLEDCVHPKRRVEEDMRGTRFRDVWQRGWHGRRRRNGHVVRMRRRALSKMMTLLRLQSRRRRSFLFSESIRHPSAMNGLSDAHPLPPPPDYHTSSSSILPRLVPSPLPPPKDNMLLGPASPTSGAQTLTLPPSHSHGGGRSEHCIYAHYCIINSLQV